MILDKVNFLELAYSMPFVFLYENGIDFLSIREAAGRRPDVKAVTFPFVRTTDMGARCIFISKEIYKRISALRDEDISISETVKDGKHFIKLNDVKIQSSPTKYKVS
jgi:hypothetical protein